MRPLVGASLALLRLGGNTGAATGPRLDFVDAKSGAMSYEIIQCGRIDMYDTKSN